MGWSSPPDIRLTKRQRRELRKLAARTSAPHALVQRARMILRLASGQWPATVARALGVSDHCVRKWRARWLLTRDVRGLEDADRPGRPARISVAVKCELVEMACDRNKEVAFREV
jgi:transposase